MPTQLSGAAALMKTTLALLHVQTTRYTDKPALNIRTD